jgi:hypothetical protein
MVCGRCLGWSISGTAYPCELILYVSLGLVIDENAHGMEKSRRENRIEYPNWNKIGAAFQNGKGCVERFLTGRVTAGMASFAFRVCGRCKFSLNLHLQFSRSCLSKLSRRNDLPAGARLDSGAFET